jgi:hypothetical protein
VKFYDWRKTFKEHLLGIFLQSLQYAIDDEKVCRAFKYVWANVKSAQTKFQNYITWPKKYGEVNMNGTRLALNLV